MTDERDLWRAADEPSPADFERADEEAAQTRAVTVLDKILRGLVALIVAIALFLYFVAPFSDVFSARPYHWRAPRMGTHAIPLAPQRKSNAKQPA